MSIEMIMKVYYLRNIDLVGNILVNLGAKVKLYCFLLVEVFNSIM